MRVVMRTASVTHPPLKLQDFLRSGRAPSELEALYAIKAKRHQQYPNLVLFRYNQIESPFAEEIVRECRGIILDESDNWRVVSRAFDKFFNYGEGHAANIDWATARVQEKIDGSLAVLYWYDSKWHVATSGTPDASGDVNDFGITFAELFWRNYKYELPVDNGYCFYFELTSPFNRVVVQHPTEGLTLLGARDLKTQLEVSSVDAHLMCGVPYVREFTLTSFDEIAATFTEMSPLSQEGYVVVDGAFNRVKVKHPGYVALHHAKDGISRKAFVEIVRNGERSEVLSAFPEFKPMMDDAAARFDELSRQLEADYLRLCSIPVQKDFAVEAVKTRCPGALFAVRAKKADSIRGFLKDMRIDAVMEMLGYKGQETEQAAQ